MKYFLIRMALITLFLRIANCVIVSFVAQLQKKIVNALVGDKTYRMYEKLTLFTIWHSES